MRAIDDPYTPNAGRRPAVLAGRSEEEGAFSLMLERLTLGRSAKSMMLIGLRGVGKTVLLGRFAELAETKDWVALESEMTKGSSLGRMMGPLSRTALLRLSPRARWQARAERAAGVIRNFQLTFNPDGSTGFSWNNIAAVDGYGDSGALDNDLADLLLSLGEVAREHHRGVAFLLDEVQFIKGPDLEALIVAFHKTIQKELPIAVVLAGLPILPRLVGEAKSYAERIFDKPEIGPLPKNEALRALVGPALALGVKYEPAAAARAVAYTEGYPFFIQEIGSAVWKLAIGPDVITEEEMETAIPLLEEQLDQNFFSIRIARSSDLELAYLRAMAELPRGPKASGAIATTMGYKGSEAVGATRANLIDAGLIYTPGVGLADFTVPQFDLYLKRSFPFALRQQKRRGARPAP